MSCTNRQPSWGQANVLKRLNMCCSDGYRQSEQVELPGAQGYPSEGCPLQSTRTNRSIKQQQSPAQAGRGKKGWELHVLEGLQLFHSWWPWARSPPSEDGDLWWPSFKPRARELSLSCDLWLLYVIAKGPPSSSQVPGQTVVQVHREEDFVVKRKHRCWVAVMSRENGRDPIHFSLRV